MASKKTGGWERGHSSVTGTDDSGHSGLIQCDLR